MELDLICLFFFKQNNIGNNKLKFKFWNRVTKELGKDIEISKKILIMMNYNTKACLVHRFSMNPKEPERKL